jgi:hypothetical protein
MRSSGFVQSEKFRFLPAGSQRHDSLTWSARGRAQAEKQSRGDGVGSASNRHKPSFNGRKPCGGLSCTGCLWAKGEGLRSEAETHCFGEILERRLCIRNAKMPGGFCPAAFMGLGSHLYRHRLPPLRSPVAAMDSRPGESHTSNAVARRWVVLAPAWRERSEGRPLRRISHTVGRLVLCPRRSPATGRPDAAPRAPLDLAAVAGSAPVQLKKLSAMGIRITSRSHREPLVPQWQILLLQISIGGF